MKLQISLQLLAIAGCAAAAWWMTPRAAAVSRQPVVVVEEQAVAEPTVPVVRPRKLPPELEEFSHLLARPDEELATMYLSEIQAAPRARYAAALLCAVRDESVRRHLLDVQSWGLMVVLEELNALLVKAGLRPPPGPAQTMVSGVGVNAEEWAALQQLAEENCAAAVEAALSREGLTPGDRLGQLRALLLGVRDKNIVRAAAATNALPEDIWRVLQAEWDSGPGILPANRKSLDEALAVHPTLRAGRMRDAVTSKIAETFVKIDARGAVKWANTLGKDDFMNASSRMRGLLTGARITPGEGTRLHASWPGSPSGSKDELTAFADRMSESWDRNDFPHTLLDAWTEQAPRAAAAWLAEVGGQDHGVYNAAYLFVRKWAVKDAAASATWVKSLPPGDLRDHACCGLAEVQAKSQPVLALRTALSVQSPERRQRIVASTAGEGTADPVIVEQRLRQAGASADEIAEVLKPYKTRTNQ